jgi:hypothetical protein
LFLIFEEPFSLFGFNVFKEEKVQAWFDFELESLKLDHIVQRNFVVASISTGYGMVMLYFLYSEEVHVDLGINGFEGFESQVLFKTKTLCLEEPWACSLLLSFGMVIL